MSTPDDEHPEISHAEDQHPQETLAEQGAATARAQAQEVMLADIFQQAPVGFVLCDETMIARQTNTQATQLLELSSQQLLGQSLETILINYIGIDRAHEMLERFRVSPDQRPRIAFHAVRIPRDGIEKPRYADVEIRCLTGATATTTGVLFTLVDVSDYVQTLDDLDFERARWRATLATLPVPLIVVDTEGVVQLANAIAEQIWQRPLAGMPLTSILTSVNLYTAHTHALIPPDERPLARALHGEAVCDVEVELERPDGTRVPLLLSATPIATDHTMIAAVQIGLDLTKQYEANRAKDAFLAMVTHDLKAPLAAIKGWAELAREAKPDERDLLNQALDIIVKNATLQQHLVSDLLDATALTTGTLKISPTEQDLRPLVRDIVLGEQAVAAEKSITLTFEIPDTATSACVDTLRFRQMLGNLLENAIKYTPPGGRITVRLSRQDRWAVVAVQDTGKGIAPAVLPHIFERFYRVPEEQGTDAHSLGLGLSIVKMLVALHGGEITADSPGLEQGSTFTMRLPGRCPQS